MLANTSLTRRVLGSTVGVTLALALAVSAGAVPRPGDGVHTAATSEVEELAAPAARQPGDAAAPAATVPPAPAPTAAPTTTPAPAPATTVAKPRVTAPPTTKAPKVAVAAKAPVVTAAPAPPAPPAPAPKVARRAPSAAEVQAVIAELKKRIPLLAFVTVTPAQIDQIGDQVCTAFDNGQSFAQVKATGLSMIPPQVSVPPGTDDWAVRKAVALYCPGHADKLV